MNMRNYMAFYQGRKMLLTADTLLQAQTEAARRFGAKQRWNVAVYLADVPVSTASLG
jgi:hypothetical protein